MSKFTSIDELQEAISFLKRTPDNYYGHMTAFQTLGEGQGISEILEKANKLYKQLNESNSKGTLLEKQMLLD